MIVTWYRSRLDRWCWRIALTLWALVTLGWAWLELFS